MSKKDYEYIMEMSKKRECCNCKFFDSWCCMYKCSLVAILDEEESAQNCEHFELGKYNQDELEKSNYM